MTMITPKLLTAIGRSRLHPDEIVRRLEAEAPKKEEAEPSPSKRSGRYKRRDVRAET